MPGQPDRQRPSHPPAWWTKFAGIVFLIGGGYYLWMQHRAHVLQYAPLAVFLLCPLMHLFGGHGGHGTTRADDHLRHQQGGTL